MPWCVGATLVLCIVIFPLGFLFAEVSQPPTDGWSQLSEYNSGETLSPEIIAALPPELQAEYLPKEPSSFQQFVDWIFYKNFHQTTLYTRSLYTLTLLIAVASLSLIIGTSLAWLMASRKFKGKATLTFLLALPIAIPTYIMATSYKLLTTDLQLSSSIWMREKYGANAMIDFDHSWNFLLAIFVLTAAFYPYVFLAARSAFSSISSDYLETSHSLGKGRFYTFYRITLPLARPAIIGGLMLVCLETLNEYGAMKILGIETLMTEIFRIRSGTNDLNTALRVSGCLMGIIFVLLALELFLRGRKKYSSSRSSTLSESAPKASKSRLAMIYGLSLPVLFFCFALPMYELLRLAYYGTNKASFSDYSGPIFDSILLASQASILVMVVALFLAYAQRKFSNIFFKIINKACSLGYALPGAILGVIMITWVGSSLSSNYAPIVETLFYGSTYGLIIAYAIRFLTIGINTSEAGFSQIPKALDEASAQLRQSNISTFFKVHLPLLKPSLIAGFLILFIDILKELPLTLIMQPFNTETLAMQTYALFATQEEFGLGSIPALILIFTGIIGMVIVKLILKPKSRLS